MLGLGWPSGATSGYGGGAPDFGSVLAMLQGNVAPSSAGQPMAPSGPSAPMANMIGQGMQGAPQQSAAQPGNFGQILQMLMAQQSSAAPSGFPTGLPAGNGLPAPHAILQHPVVQQILAAMMSPQNDLGGGGGDGGAGAGSGGNGGAESGGDTGSAGQG